MSTHKKKFLDRRDDNFCFLNRQYRRIRTKGVVALSSSDRTVVSLVYDIAQGGVSFWHANDKDLVDHEFAMDIVIFNVLLDIEYHLNHIKGRVKWRSVALDPRYNIPTYRYHVQFLNLDQKNINVLRTFCHFAEITAFAI